MSADGTAQDRTGLPRSFAKLCQLARSILSKWLFFGHLESGTRNADAKDMDVHSLRSLRALVRVVPFVVLFAACGGRALDVTGGSTSGADGGGGGAGQCIQVDSTSFDATCNADSDCALVGTGKVCPGECGCGGQTPVSRAGVAAWQAATSGLDLTACPCADLGEARCFEHTCRYCSLVPDQGGNSWPECGSDSADSGIVPPEDAAPPPPPDASICVDIDPSTYDQSCTQSSDCISVSAGELCTGFCPCGGATINASEEMRYSAAIAGIESGLCGCPLLGNPTCVNGQCAICSGPNPSPGCPDGG